MNEAILECDSFELDVGDIVFRSSGFSLHRHQVAILHGLSTEKIGDFLYLISGLYNKRGITNPAKRGTLIREEVKIDSEKLGFIKFLGQPLDEFIKNNIERARHIGFIFENPQLFIIGNTVFEEFRYSFAAIGRSPLPSQYLERYGFGERKIDYQTEFLSGGEYHRLNCAAVLELAPDLLVADFSSSNLDSDFTECLIDWLQDLAVRKSAVFLTGLHSSRFTKITPVTYVLENGELIQKAPDPQLFPTDLDAQAELHRLLQKRSPSDRNVLKVDAVGRPSVTLPVSFNLKEGEILIIRGANGSGKTTLGKILTGRIRWGYIGKFWHDGNEPVMSPQFPERSFIMNTVAEELPDETLLQICGITSAQRTLHPRKLPSSQQKLLSVAITLQLSKGYAVLDEPTSGMDFPSKQKFIDLLNHFKDKAVLIITHDEAISFPGMTRYWKSLIGE